MGSLDHMKHRFRITNTKRSSNLLSIQQCKCSIFPLHFTAIYRKYTQLVILQYLSLENDQFFSQIRRPKCHETTFWKVWDQEKNMNMKIVSIFSSKQCCFGNKKNYSKEYRVILLFKNILLICDWACTQIIMRDVCTNVCTLISQVRCTFFIMAPTQIML